MLTKKALPILLAMCAVLACRSSSAQGNVTTGEQPAIHIDVPTKLKKANVVVDVGHLVFGGDMPFAFGDIKLLASDLREWRTNGQVVAIFHGDAAYLVLNDAAYDVNRHGTTGNRFKTALNELMALGVQIELCGATASANHWTNTDLLPGVKVNLNAMVRLTQLEQDGYTLIYE
jgi:intracellular sulfur oxidation DsrE/DsrF family protein